MKCNIHCHIEVKIKGIWEHYSCPTIKRNYDLFGKMAGVRSDITPIVKAKGIPENLSKITQIDYDWWYRDAHTHSWYNEDEIRILEEYMQDLDPYKTQLGWLFGNYIGDLHKYGEYPKEIEDVRLIFWFDN